MRRIVTWALSTVTVLVLLFSYHTSTSSAVAPTEQVAAAGGQAPTGGQGATSGQGDTSGPGATSGQAATGSAAGGSGSAQSGASSVAGDAVSTRFGPVQVQVSVAGGGVTAATVLQVPSQDRHDQMINGRAVPILNAEAVSAQSARIDAVSGATVTSDAYAESLQSALDKAHL